MPAASATRLVIVSASARRRVQWQRLLGPECGFRVAGAASTLAAALAACPGVEAILLDARRTVASPEAGQGAHALAPLLSQREQQVLALLAEGCRDKCLPERLGVSAGTARTYLRRAKAKLGAASRTEAVARWLSLARDGISAVAKNGDKARLTAGREARHHPAPKARPPKANAPAHRSTERP